MTIFQGTENANILKPTVLTLGVFDGLHLGHQRIMQTVVERANEGAAHRFAQNAGSREVLACHGG